MMPGFVQVDRHTFYADIWPRIEKDVEAVESNWADAKKGVRPIVITQPSGNMTTINGPKPA